MDVALDNLWILLGENLCWSLLGLKRVNQHTVEFVANILKVRRTNVVQGNIKKKRNTREPMKWLALDSIS